MNIALRGRPLELLIAACEQAEQELAALPLPQRLRVRLGGFGAVEAWISRRAAEILAEQAAEG